MTTLTQLTQLIQFTTALEALRSGALRPHDFSDQVRGLSDLHAALPEKYAIVLNNVLDRLESSALFTEESCSFSQSGLIENLQMWSDKAQALLQSTP